MRQIGRKGLLWLLTGILLICPAFAVSAFPDVDENAEYADAVACVKDMGIMIGDEQGKFNPNKTVTRAEMATIICNMLGETEGLTESAVFSDVPTSHWANKYISKAEKLGIVSGYGNGLFGPSDPVTYEQALVMFIHAFGADDAANAEGGFPDGYIKIASDGNLSENVFAQKGDAMARWQISMMIYNSFR